MYRLSSLTALLAVVCTGCFFGGSDQVAEAPATTATTDTAPTTATTPASPAGGGQMDGMSGDAEGDYMNGGGQYGDREDDDAPDMEMGYGEDRREGDDDEYGDGAPEMEMGYGEDRRREGDGDDDAPEMEMGYGEDRRREGDGDDDDAPEMEMGYGEDRRGEGDGDGDDAPEMEMGYGEDRRGGEGGRGDDGAPEMEMGYGDDRRGGEDGAPSMSGFGESRGGSSAQTFAGKAANAFQQGKDGEAINYLIADALSNGSSQTLTKFRWVKGLKQPALAVRWGIGVNYVPTNGFSGDPRAIGTGPQAVNNGGGNGRGGGGYEDGAGMQMNMDEGGDSSSMGMGMGGGGARDQDLKKYTGDLGQHVVEELKKRIRTGSFGVVLAEAKGKSGGASREGEDSDFGDMMSMDEGRGGFDGRGGGGGGNGNAGGGSATSVTPGVAYLGKGSPKELLNKAEREGVHLLVVFDVRAGKHPRSGIVFNNTKAELFDVKAGKSLAKARELRNMEVENRRKTKKDDNTIEIAYKRFFESTDLAYKVSELPEALSQFASGRVNQLASGQYPNVLPVLAEIKLYHSRQWIDDTQLTTAFAALIGVTDGEKLATGSAQAKKEVLAKLVKG